MGQKPPKWCVSVVPFSAHVRLTWVVAFATKASVEYCRHEAAEPSPVAAGCVNKEVYILLLRSTFIEWKQRCVVPVPFSILTVSVRPIPSIKVELISYNPQSTGNYVKRRLILLVDKPTRVVHGVEKVVIVRAIEEQKLDCGWMWKISGLSLSLDCRIACFCYQYEEPT